MGLPPSSSATFGRRRDEIGIETEEPRECDERFSDRADPRQRLRLVRLDGIGLDRLQPQQVEKPQIAAEHVGAQRRQCREPVGFVFPVLLGFQFLALDVDD
ncbi:hypothetical protein [Mesorhizobium sp.]|nr:hypothetical protein [Mesorhizobium sp.]